MSDWKDVNTPGYRHGQICLLLSACHIVEKSNFNHIRNNIIEKHFANLMENDPFELKLGDRYLLKNNTYWHAELKFKPPESDLLLHLCSMGMRGNQFNNNSLCEAVEETIGNQKFGLTYSNPNAVGNDGNEKEALVAASIVIASRSNGLKGCTVGTLLNLVAFHLGMTSLKDKVISHDQVHIQSFLDINVPFLSFPNVEMALEKTLKITCDVLMRTKNQDQIDFKIFSPRNPKVLLMTGECKDRQKFFNTTDLEEACRRKPKDSMIHLIFVNHLMLDTFYKKRNNNSSSCRSYSDFVAQNYDLQNTYLFKFDGASLSGIGGIENQCRCRKQTHDKCHVKSIIIIVVQQKIQLQKKNSEKNLITKKLKVS
jgi:hypothetical protein